MRPLLEEGPDYRDLIDSFEHEVLVEHMVGNYQGDYLFLLRDGDRYGYLVVGYGSCGGCDALEAAFDTNRYHPDGCAVTDLRDWLYTQVRWEDSAQAMLEYLSEHDWEGSYYGAEYLGFQTAAINALEAS